MIILRNVFNTLKPARNLIFDYNRRTMSLSNVPVLYGDEASPPVRFVMMTASILKIQLDFRKVDLFLGENKTELYSKINPLHKVPALDTGKQVICDSHAIALHLCRQSKHQDLYPEDNFTRARVDQMLFFNSGLLFPADSLIFTEYFAGKPVNTVNVDHWYRLLSYLEGQLRSQPWLAGEKMTLSDLCCGTTISSLQLLVPITDQHPKVNEWMKILQQQPCFEINLRGLKRLATMVEKYVTNSKQ
ncbi:glutathione S-transferase E14-like isoform X1 [Ostrinia nubilalis]|uniref:glutathione S-transferase E14-like isoform X1 n=2 Tax=Ostrinia nubilalis TaxID=29057 RepID=UPI00308224C8